ncbi:MAG: Glycosyltransferase [Rhodobacteraceae bacterium HLUCCA08]|nr:MAG: Glycosyltransferase [Rhodobacteraceae bacterium HLUCCA08]
MKITFVIPFASVNGGIRVVASYARALTDAGHDVTVVSQPNPVTIDLKRRVKTLLGRDKGARKPPVRTPMFDFLGPRHIELTERRPVTAADLPDADAVFATWWETAEWVNALPPAKGSKFYLLQDYETFAPQPADRVIRTYGFDMQKIAVSGYIRDIIVTNHGVAPFPVIPNAVDHRQFDAPPRQRNPRFRVGLLFSSVARKRVSLALEALNLAKGVRPDLEALVFGKHRPEPPLALPDWARFVRNPPQAEIPDIYAACDAWVLASEHEGFGLPILEAMACRTPVISTRAGAAPDLIDGGNGCLVDGTPQAMAAAIERFAAMTPAEWQGVSDAAKATADAITWEACARRMADIVAARLTAPTGGRI